MRGRRAEVPDVQGQQAVRGRGAVKLRFTPSACGEVRNIGWLRPSRILHRAIPPDTVPAMELFVAFARMSLAGFGGVLEWARRAIVDQPPLG